MPSMSSRMARTSAGTGSTPMAAAGKRGGGRSALRLRGGPGRRGSREVSAAATGPRCRGVSRRLCPPPEGPPRRLPNGPARYAFPPFQPPSAGDRDCDPRGRKGAGTTERVGMTAAPAPEPPPRPAGGRGTEGPVGGRVL